MPSNIMSALPASRSCIAGARAAVGHVHDLGLGLELKQFARRGWWAVPVPGDA
jgi:hypothetical protein